MSKINALFFRENTWNSKYECTLINGFSVMTIVTQPTYGRKLFTVENIWSVIIPHQVWKQVDFVYLSILTQQHVP